MARPVHHQEGDEAAALIDDRQADLAAELVRLGNAGGEHLEARRLGEAMGGDKIRHGANPACRNHSTRARVLGANSSSAVTGLVMMPCVSACPRSASMTMRFGAMP